MYSGQVGVCCDAGSSQEGNQAGVLVVVNGASKPHAQNNLGALFDTHLAPLTLLFLVDLSRQSLKQAMWVQSKKIQTSMT
jgi:hypothetical protein